MNFRTKLLGLNFIPLLVFVIISLALGITQFRSAIYVEKEGNLRSVALAALTLYSSQGYGDYRRREDGNVWRGMNTNISERTAIVDDLKRQTEVDITFFFEDRAVMTSIMDRDGDRCLGMIANPAVDTYILGEGKQLWCRSIKINGKTCQAYIIPIRQESDGSVAGALMASQSADEFNAIIGQYILITLIVMLLVLVAVSFFVYWHTEWFAQKFSEITDRSRQDLLTGLCNKLTFENDAIQALSEKKPEETVALLIFDFDNFKHVNDNFGHQTGDEALKAFANILLRAFRSSDIIGRVGGDEFMAFMDGLNAESVKRAEEIAQEVQQELNSLKLGDAGPFSCSIGIGTDETGYDFPKLYQLADSALYEAKKRGKACFVRYSSADRKMDDHTENRTPENA